MSIIKIENMSFSYTNTSKTLKDINMEIKKYQHITV